MAVLFVFILLAAPGRAAADLNACGEIHIEANAQCKVEVSGGCKTMCEPVRFETVCTTRRYNVCKKQCTLEPPTVDCKGSCGVDCDAKCKVDPGSVECYGSCKTSCMANCEGYCQSSSTSANCKASCSATCGTECNASCIATLPSASCSAKCTAGCDGSCKITPPYVDCQVKCQEKELQDCETTMKGGCETQCEKPEGALFCDGQYIDHGGKARECIDSLNAWLKSLVDVSASASLSSDCADGVCVVSVEVGCDVGGQNRTTPWMLFLLFGFLAAAVVLSANRRR
jgi:hypothetical protein